MNRSIVVAGALFALWPRYSAAEIDGGADALPAAPPAAIPQNPPGPEGVASVKESSAVDKVGDAVSDWEEKVADFDKLHTPDSPAAVILGVSPTEIQRPGTPTAVAATLGGFLSDGFNIPKNLAVELAPYWLFPHRYLTAHDYQEGGARNIYRTLTLSIASKQTDRQSVDVAGVTSKLTDSNLGVGLRMRLVGFSPYQSKTCTDQVQALKSAAQEMAGTYVVPQAEEARLREKYGFGTPEYQAGFEALREKGKAEQEKAYASLTQIQSKLDKRCFDVAASTQGWSSDFAAAGDFYFAESKATKSASQLSSGAAWLTLAYASDMTSGVVLGRYAARKVAGDWQNVADGGLRLILKGKTYALSGEGIARWRVTGSDKGWTYKVDIAVEYAIRDQIWATVVFGKNYDSDQPGSIFSLANLSYGFGKPTIGGPATTSEPSPEGR